MMGVADYEAMAREIAVYEPKFGDDTDDFKLGYRCAQSDIAPVVRRALAQSAAAERERCELVARGKLSDPSNDRYRVEVGKHNGREWGPDSEYGRGRHDAADAIAALAETKVDSEYGRGRHDESMVMARETSTASESMGLRGAKAAGDKRVSTLFTFSWARRQRHRRPETKGEGR